MVDKAQQQETGDLDISTVLASLGIEDVDKKETKPASQTQTDDDLDETGDKDTPSPGGEDDEDDVETEEEVDLQSQIAGLTKELSRVRKDRNSSTQEVQALRDRLAQVQGMLEGLTKNRGGDSNRHSLEQFTEKELVQGQGEWEDALFEARDAARQARTDGDHTVVAKAEQAASVARKTLQAIREELLDRSRKASAEHVRAQSETDKVLAEVRNLYTEAYENIPELTDNTSTLWKAGKDEYDSHADLMRALGPLGELVAVAMAVARDPSLIRGKDKREARRELLSEIDKKAEKVLFKQGSKTKQKSTPDFSKMSNTELDSIVHKLKFGG